MNIHSIGKFFARFVANPLLITLCLIIPPTQAKSQLSGDLPRTADLGFSTTIKDDTLVIRRIVENSAAEVAGLKVDDTILEINDKSVGNLLDAQHQLSKQYGGKSISLKISRINEKSAKQRSMHTIVYTPPAKPLESIPSVTSLYADVKLDSDVRLRTIISLPDSHSPNQVNSSNSKLPSLFFVQWVSCGSIEVRPKSLSRSILAQLAQKSERAVVRVERSASGDSQGPACHQLDYDTELKHYVEAFAVLANHPSIDRNKIVLYGSSLGSTLAPLIAEQLKQKHGINVEGIVIQGGGGLSHFERMLNFDRIFLERRPDFPSENIHSEMLDRAVFHSEYLIKLRHPDDIAKDSENMANIRQHIRGLNKETHYGRPFAWHQQANQHNVLKAWKNTNASVLVVFNEFDQFETRHGHKVIVDMINRWRPDTAKYIEQKSIGHSQYRYNTTEEAYAFKGGEPMHQQTAQHILQWLKTI